MKKILFAVSLAFGMVVCMPALAASTTNAPMTASSSMMMPGGQGMMYGGNGMMMVSRGYPAMFARHSRGIAVWFWIASSITMVLVWLLLVTLIMGLWHWSCRQREQRKPGM